MDINQIKKQAEEENNARVQLADAITEALTLLEKKDSIEQGCYSKWHERTRLETEKIIEESIRFFKETGFDVTRESDYVSAKYINVEIRITDINDHNGPMYVYNAGISHEFRISSQPGGPDYSSTSEVLHVEGKKSFDFMKEGRIDETAFIKSLSSVSQVNEIKKQINSFIDYYTKGILTIDDLHFCIIRFGDSKTYSSFADYFNDLR